MRSHQPNEYFYLIFIQDPYHGEIALTTGSSTSLTEVLEEMQMTIATTFTPSSPPSKAQVLHPNGTLLSSMTDFTPIFSQQDYYLAREQWIAEGRKTLPPNPKDFRR